MKKAFLAGVALALMIAGAAPVRAQIAVGGTANSSGTCQTATQQVNVPGTSRSVYVDKYGNLCVNNVGSGGSQPSPLAVTTTNDSTTVTTGSTFQTVVSSNAARKDCLIQNPTTATEPLFVFFGANGSATTATSITLNPGGSVSCINGVVVKTDNVSVTAATTGHVFYADNE